MIDNDHGGVGVRYLGLLLCAVFGGSGALAASHHKVVEDHGRLGKWIMSSRAPIDDDDDGDAAQRVPALESAGDPPAPPSSLVLPFTSEPSSVVYRGYRSYQVNVNPQGRNIMGDAANEPSIAMDPNNPSHLVVGWRQFDSVASNFRQAGNAYSLDGGTTWHNEPVLTGGVFRSDPVVLSTGGSDFYYLSLLETFYDSIFGTMNSGAKWSLLQENATGGDKQWFTIDTTDGPGHGNMYQDWSTAGNNWNERQFSRSTDGGRTWEDPIYLPNYPIWGTLDVDSRGDLYIGGIADNYYDYFTCLKSTNAKYRGTSPTFGQVANVNLGGTLSFGAFINPGGLSGQTFLAVDKSLGATSGYVYMLASVAVDNNNPCDVMFVRSTDGGVTWSSPKRLSEDPVGTGVFHWFGTISVAPNGRLDAFWLDNRADPNSAVSVLYWRCSYDGGKTWTHETQLCPPFDPTVGYPNQNKIGDYMTVVSDIKGANLAYSATFNNEEDIWFLRVPAPKKPDAEPDLLTVYQGNRTSAGFSSVEVPGTGSAATVEASYTLSETLPGSMRLDLRTRTGAPASGAVWLYNWLEGRYECQGAFRLKDGGRTEVDLAASSAYVGKGRRVRVMFRAEASQPFTMSLDKIALAYG